MIARDQFPFNDRQCIVILDEAHKDYSIIFEKYPINIKLNPNLDKSKKCL
jgi:hypothetical protein